MDFFADLNKILQEHLTASGVSFPPAESTERLMLMALNHDRKIVKAMPRKAHCSTEFTAKLSGLDSTQQNAAAAIIAKFESGQEVSGHQSKASVKAGEIDALLADWDIYHFHISNHKDKPTDLFYARTGPVMFAQITKTDVYFIDIYEHGTAFPETWTRRELLDILETNWPHLLDGCRVKGVTGVRFQATDLELKRLRKAKVNTIIQVGNSFIMPPGGGLATDGTPAEDVTRMNQIFHSIKRLERWTQDNAAELKAKISAKNGLAESELEFRLVVLEGDEWGSYEVKSKTLVRRIK